jgi:hypothetical protein
MCVRARSLAAGDDAHVASLARHPALWQPLALARWPAGVCRPELYDNDWHALYTARNGLPPMLLKRFDECVRALRACVVPPLGADAARVLWVFARRQGCGAACALCCGFALGHGCRGAGCGRRRAGVCGLGRAHVPRQRGAAQRAGGCGRGHRRSGCAAATVRR